MLPDLIASVFAPAPACQALERRPHLVDRRRGHAVLIRVAAAAPAPPLRRRRSPAAAHLLLVPSPRLHTAGKRFNVKATPMQPLSAVVADVLGQLRLEGLAPEQCQLLLRGKPLDLATPVRFANIGRDKLELVTGEGRQEGAGRGCGGQAPLLLALQSPQAELRSWWAGRPGASTGLAACGCVQAASPCWGCTPSRLPLLQQRRRSLHPHHLRSNRSSSSRSSSLHPRPQRSPPLLPPHRHRNRRLPPLAPQQQGPARQLRRRRHRLRTRTPRWPCLGAGCGCSRGRRSRWQTAGPARARQARSCQTRSSNSQRWVGCCLGPAALPCRRWHASS